MEKMYLHYITNRTSCPGILTAVAKELKNWNS